MVYCKTWDNKYMNICVGIRNIRVYEHKRRNV